MRAHRPAAPVSYPRTVPLSRRAGRPPLAAAGGRRRFPVPAQGFQRASLASIGVARDGLLGPAEARGKRGGTAGELGIAHSWGCWDR